MKKSDSKSKIEELNVAMPESERRKRIDELRSLLGKVPVDSKEVKKLRELELREAKRQLG